MAMAFVGVDTTEYHPMPIEQSHPEPEHMEWGNGMSVLYLDEGRWIQFDPEQDAVEVSEHC